MTWYLKTAVRSSPESGVCLLREYLDNVLREGPVSVQEAELGGLALLTTQSGTGRSWNLVNVSKVQSDLKRGVSLRDALKAGLLGYLQIAKAPKCGEDTWSVSYSAAEKGFGPLIYDIGLSMIHPGWVTSDRFSVSDKALKVWDIYLRGRSDVEKEPLDLDSCGMDWTSVTTLTPETRSLKNKILEMEPVVDGVGNAIATAKKDGRENVTFFPWTSRGRSSTTSVLSVPKAEQYHRDLQDQYQALVSEFNKATKDQTKDSPMAWKFRIRTPLNVSALVQNGEQLRDLVQNTQGVVDLTTPVKHASTLYFSEKL